MNDYIKQDRRKRLKGYLRTAVFILLVFIICILSYYIYMKIEVDEAKIGETEKETSNIGNMQTVESVNENDKEIVDVIRGVNECVVGISKIKNAGNTIFFKDSASQLGLGTGMIVTENGYILSNEHVTGAKYSNCYVTLENGRSYSANVVWSDSNLDLSICKINVKFVYCHIYLILLPWIIIYYDI